MTATIFVQISVVLRVVSRGVERYITMVIYSVYSFIVDKMKIVLGNRHIAHSSDKVVAKQQ